MGDPEAGRENPESGKEKPVAEAEKSEASEQKPGPDPENQLRPWLRPVLAGLALLAVTGGVGFGLGYLNRPAGSGPDLSAGELERQAREQTLKQVRRKMTRQGLIDGKRSGRNHGIIAGGMAAESAVTIEARQRAASQAQSAAASARSELAAISSAPPPPVPAGDEAGADGADGEEAGE